MCHVTCSIRILSSFVCLLLSISVNGYGMHRTTIDQGIAYVLMLVALVLTYIIHETN
ncbi:hypothetical protein MKW94_027930 [Papaver nudicaule]|uniref:Uncharacterized protein n=1 Tax=Papaver nudicaule TaxID=74823 RepID=A0AA41RRC9_PAPNU|nr:hypothetical protein [Papaver nudicaule]